MPLVAASFTSDLCRLCDFDVAKISTFFVTTKLFCNYLQFFVKVGFSIGTCRFEDWHKPITKLA